MASTRRNDEARVSNTSVILLLTSQSSSHESAKLGLATRGKKTARAAIGSHNIILQNHDHWKRNSRFIFRGHLMSTCFLLSQGRRASPLSLSRCRPLSIFNSSSIVLLHRRGAITMANPTNSTRQPLLPQHPSSPKSTSRFVPHRLSYTMASSDSVGSPDVEWSARRVRETFLEYFKKNGHTIGTSANFIVVVCDGTTPPKLIPN